jgi:hypothetical protein
MTERTYILAFDPLDPSFDPLTIKRAIKANKAFPNWWNHIATVFLVKTALTAEQISDFVKSAAKDATFLVMEVDPRNSEGMLPQQSWDWIRSRENEREHATQAMTDAQTH